MATLYAYSPNGTQATLSYSVLGFTQSIVQNGWCKLPNGLIFQWSKVSSSTRSITFPIAFSSVFYSCGVFQSAASSRYNSRIAYSSVSNSTLTISTIEGAMVPWFYICIGK